MQENNPFSAGSSGSKFYCWWLLALNLLLSLYLLYDSFQLITDYRGGLEMLWIYSPAGLCNLLFYAACWGKLGATARKPLPLSLLLFLAGLATLFGFWLSALGAY